MLLAALPATPVQTVHACYRYGFEIVVPASWGDELVAQAVLEDLKGRDREPVIQCTCPLVAGRLLASGEHLLASMVQTASPPVAAARYARQLFSPRAVHITYVGACPGAEDSAIDQRFLPDEFLRLLDERDIALADMPTVFDSVLPPDRRRFVSLPGGCPSQEALWQASDGRMLREVTQPTFSTDLAQTLLWREYVMIDVAPSLGCACAGSYSRVGTRYGRVAVMALEPPRAVQPVVAYEPEFAAITEPEPPELGRDQRHNGQEPTEHPARGVEREEPVSAATVRETSVAVASSAVRVRTPSAALPRAYLAKRRHLATVAREPQQRDMFAAEPLLAPGVVEAAPVEQPPAPPPAEVVPAHDEPRALQPLVASVPRGERVGTQPAGEPVQRDQSVATQATIEPDLRAESLAPQAERMRGAELPRVHDAVTEPPPFTAAPNAAPPLERVDASDVRMTPGEVEQEYVPGLLTPPEAQPASADGGVGPGPQAASAPNEQADFSRPITVHVEPAGAAPEETRPSPPPEPTPAPPAPAQAGREVQPDTAVALEEPASARRRFAAPPWERPAYRPREEAAAIGARPSEPLRVEVEIDAEIEIAQGVASHPEIVIPDAVHRGEPGKPRAVVELVAQPARSWGDILIALWLVLVASAVIAALLWRR